MNTEGVSGSPYNTTTSNMTSVLNLLGSSILVNSGNANNLLTTLNNLNLNGN